MPIRIYALAKDLNLDSKELVEVCKRAGIHGKGSALASLDDDEVDKVKAFLSGPPKTEAKPAPASSTASSAVASTPKSATLLASMATEDCPFVTWFFAASCAC